MENNNNLSLKSLSSDEINKIEEFRKAKQTAVLAILFSDIANSTYATEKLGEQVYSRLRHIHDEIFKRVMCRDNAGVIIKEIGDSFLCVFAEPSTAVLRAVEFQQAIHSNKENLTVQGYTLTVKIGIHVGQVAVENSLALDIFGRHVNRASRIESLASGGQILTSYSIWENAVGWLKDNNKERIGWVSYGKTKLKGVDERIDIFEFYPTDTGKQPTPKIIRKQKTNRILLLSSIFFILAIATVFCITKVVQTNNHNTTSVLSSARKSYYIQFDFSDFAKPAKSNSENPIIDTVSLQGLLLTEAISVLNPDSVITESDLINTISRKGKIYVRHVLDGENPRQYLEDINFFRDTLGFSGVILIKAAFNSKIKNEPIKLYTRFMIYESANSYTGTAHDDSYNLENIENGFRNDLQDCIIDTRHWTIQGYVLSCNDSIVLFKMTKEATLRGGAAIHFMRGYNGKEGLKQRLEDIQKRITYFKTKLSDSSNILKSFYREYAEMEEQLAQDSLTTNFSKGDGLEGKVIDLYDSTGKARWNLGSDYPYARPQKGDIIYLN